MSYINYKNLSAYPHFINSLGLLKGFLCLTKLYQLNLKLYYYKTPFPYSKERKYYRQFLFTWCLIFRFIQVKSLLLFEYTGVLFWTRGKGREKKMRRKDLEFQCSSIVIQILPWTVRYTLCLFLFLLSITSELQLTLELNRFW